MGKKILFVSPHLDDETLCSGGTIHKLARRGWDIGVLPLTLSDQAYTGERPSDFSFKMKEGSEACSVLGARLIHPEQFFPDTGLRHDPELISHLVRHVRSESPDLVITTHYEDFHHDHRMAAVACREAVYQASRTGVYGGRETTVPEPVLLFGEVDVEGVTPVKPHVFSELGEEDVAAKIRALSCYKQMFGEHGSIFSSGTPERWTKSVATIRGAQSGGLEYAEIFELGNYRPAVNLESLLP